MPYTGEHLYPNSKGGIYLYGNTGRTRTNGIGAQTVDSRYDCVSAIPAGLASTVVVGMAGVVTMVVVVVGVVMGVVSGTGVNGMVTSYSSKLAFVPEKSMASSKGCKTFILFKYK
jgi:hypothetical protein